MIAELLDAIPGEAIGWLLFVGTIGLVILTVAAVAALVIVTSDGEPRR